MEPKRTLHSRKLFMDFAREQYLVRWDERQKELKREVKVAKIRELTKNRKVDC